MTENSEVSGTIQTDSPLINLSLEEKREFVETLQKKKRLLSDKKLQKFTPTLIQRLVLMSQEKICLVLGSNRCIGGMESIYDPVEKKSRIIQDIKEQFHVYAWDGEKTVIARAGVPFKKGYGTLRKYSFSSGESIFAFDTHRLLAHDGYQPIGESFCGVSSFLSPSISGTYQKAHSEDVQSWLKRVRDFLICCSSCSYLCDEQFLLEKEISQDVFPLQADVLGHTFFSDFSHEDDQDNTQENIHFYRLSDLPSILDDHCLTLDQFFDILFQISCTLSQLTEALPQAYHLSKLAFDLLESTPESVLRGTQTNDHSFSLEACGSPYCGESILTNIEEIGEDVKWDFEVEGYSNYIHKGLIHHNSGKSEIIAVDALIRLTGIIPDSVASEYPKDFILGGDAWLSGMDFVSLMGIVKHKVDKFLPASMNSGYNKENKIQSLRNKREIQYKSYDSGREKFQGTSKAYVSFDEEPPQDIYDEGYMRTVDCSGIIRLAFTPLKGLSWAYKELYRKAHRIISTENTHGIREGIGIVHSPEEIEKLRDRKIVTVTNSGSDVDKDIVVFQMSIYDNPYLPAAEVWKAERKYADDPTSYNARILGRFTTITGRNVFATDVLIRRQPNCPKPTFIGNIVNGKLEKTIKGNLTIYKDLNELSEDEYVIGADTAEGLETGDFSCAQVLSKRTAEQVAVWHGKCPPEEFAYILVSMGKFFRNADLAPERNFHGFAVVNRIREHLKYPNLFSEYDVANLEKVGVGKSVVKRYGWDTNAKTKPLMIQELSAFIRDGHIRLNDPQTIEELITYVYDKDGRTEGMGGCFDDRVMALAIALQVFLKRRILRQPFSVEKPQPRDPYTGY